MADKENYFQSEVRWTAEKKGDLIIEGQPDLVVAAPPQFGGHPGIPSPQDLFVASAVTCIMTSFLAMGQKVRAEWKTFSCSGRGKLELVTGQGLLFTRIDLYPKVTVESEEHVEAASKALDLAKKYCLVTNSMKSEIEMHPEVTVG